MHCKRLWGTLALILAVVVGGCKQRCFLTEADFNRTTTTLIGDLELKPDLGEHPVTAPVPPPPTLQNLDRKVRFISLAECIAIALEQGTVGQQNALFPGQALDNLVQFNGPFSNVGVSGQDAIRVFALDPASGGLNVEASLSKFDAFVSTSMVWQTTDQPIGTSLQSFQAGGANSTINATNVQNAVFSTGIFKPLATGGTAAIGFGTAYTFTNLPARVNPAYQPSLQFGLDQPLLQGFGVEINQLLNSHPIGGNFFGASNAGGNNAPALNLANNGVQFQPTNSLFGVGSNGILISRVRFDQSRKEFERVVNHMLLNVEFAYWNLYGGYWTLYSREQGLRFAYEAFRLSKAGYEAGRVKAADFHQSRGQYEQFRAQRLQALDQVLEFERQLRALLGMPVEDGCRLMPSDSPTLAPYQPDWKCALEDAIARRPEVLMAREEVKVAQMNLMLAKNRLLPDLRAIATYDFNGLGSTLSGPDSAPNPITGATKDTNAFRSLASGNFSNWTVGLRLTIPIGLRVAHAQVRQAQLGLARTMETLKDQELKAQRFLARYYRQISITYETIRAQRAQREAFGEQLRARFQEFLAGRGTLDILLESQRFWADALNSEYQAIVSYNNALVGFEFGKGTLLQHDNVVISEGPLPTCAQVRAVEHERQRTAALVLRERAVPIAPANATPEPMLPNLAPSLPAVMAATPPLKDAPGLPALPNQPGQPPSTLPAPTEVKMEEMFPATPAPMTKVPTKLPAPRKTSEFGVSRDQ